MSYIKNITLRVICQEIFVTKCVDKRVNLCYHVFVTKRGKREVKLMTLAERLIKARGTRSREEVATAVGVSLSAITMYEIGARVPRDEIKVKLADYYKTTVQALFYT